MVDLVTIVIVSTDTYVSLCKQSKLPSCVAVGCHLSASCNDAAITDPSVTIDACCVSDGQSFSNETGCHMCPPRKLCVTYNTSVWKMLSSN